VRAPWWGGVAWEAGLLFALYGLWMFAGSFTVMSPAGALPRGVSAPAPSATSSVIGIGASGRATDERRCP